MKNASQSYTVPRHPLPHSLMQKWDMYSVNNSNNTACNYSGTGECLRAYTSNTARPSLPAVHKTELAGKYIS